MTHAQAQSLIEQIARDTRGITAEIVPRRSHDTKQKLHLFHRGLQRRMTVSTMLEWESVKQAWQGE